ncbi:hypothetical protein D9615_009311 [Tricholomella constricta]|uniref:Arylamine N-acetyltransferase n=1 Tax=Tricholomella constricta TaxID=117010 RepID=A0A8H5LWA7_9AGAR|nr:hypothetical protein D9615_009311 [Tricholomella constricta]
MPTDAGTLQDGQYIKPLPSAYSAGQIIQWLSRIGFPRSYSDAEISGGAFPHTLDHLEVLTRLHLIAFPFENTEMHYTAHHTIDVSLQGAFERMVINHKGSYCFGQNGLFMNMLRGLGYRAYAGSARVNMTPEDVKNPPKFTATSHMVVFVQPYKGSNETYLVDVGFGSTGLVRPILLSDREGNTVMGTTAMEKHRLRRGVHPSSSLGRDFYLPPQTLILDIYFCPDVAGALTSRADYLWTLELCHTRSDGTPLPWRLLYTFAENECFPIDAENASLVISTKPEGIFWHNLLCIKYEFLDNVDPSDEEARAQAEAERRQVTEGVKSTLMFKYVMFGREVRRNIGSSSVMIRTLGSDLERIRALKEVFGLDLPEDARVHVKGRAPSLDG